MVIDKLLKTVRISLLLNQPSRYILSYPKMHKVPLGWDSEKENEWIDFIAMRTTNN